MDYQPSAMKWLIVGAGAIGSLLGSKLARAGHDVTLVGRPDYVAAVRERGIGLEEAGRRVYANNVRAVAHVAEVAAGPFDSPSIRLRLLRTSPSIRLRLLRTSPSIRLRLLRTGLRTSPFDLIALTTKAYDTAAAAAQIQPLARQGIPLLIPQNGVGNEEIAARVLGEVTIFSAVITLAVETLEPGLVRLSTTRGGIGLAPTAPGQSVTRLANALQEAGFRVTLYPHHRAMKWSKLLLNILGNASSAILDLPPDRIFAHRRLFALERAAFCEARAVMHGLGLRPVNLPGYPVPLLAWGLCSLPLRLLQPIFQRMIVRGRGGKMPSLHLDIERGRKCSEVEFLNGAVVKEGQRLGMDVPANEALYSTLMGLVSEEVPWEAYRGRPERLLAAAGL
jgi:2-dehydropantoate 2-reductase